LAHLDRKGRRSRNRDCPAGQSALLGNARALLFPIDWDEPFGLVMIDRRGCRDVFETHFDANRMAAST
jgi:hypothetical protein